LLDKFTKTLWRQICKEWAFGIFGLPPLNKFR